MPDIVLKNILGQDVTYSGIDTVKLKNTEGGEETFSHGVAVEDVPVELDLANGETQTIYAPDGTLVKSAVVTVTGGGGGDAVEMEETELPFAAANGAYQAILPITRLFFNATYDVVWNGAEYSCTCKAMEFADSLILTVGNAALFGGEAEDVPFLIVQTPDIVGCITTEANATNTVSLKLNFEAGSGSKPTIMMKHYTSTADLITSYSTADLISSEEMETAGFSFPEDKLKCFIAMFPTNNDECFTASRAYVHSVFISGRKNIKSGSKSYYGLATNMYNGSSPSISQTYFTYDLTSSMNGGLIYDETLNAVRYVVSGEGNPLGKSYIVIAGYYE